MSQRQTDGDTRFVQLPHPGAEHRMPGSGRREWKSGNDSHARTFLESSATYRGAADGPDLHGPVAFWGEWEGAVELVRPLNAKKPRPQWLCRPDLDGAPPPSDDGTPAQNTDPFVWGDAIRYTFCRQSDNQKLRRLGRGSLILFGAGPKRGFELDTVMVVNDWVEHRSEADLGGEIDDAYRRWTVQPMYGWGENDLTYRLYFGATPESAVNGMFSFVPCQPSGSTTGFVRPILDLDGVVEGLLKPNLRMQARVVDIGSDRIREVWQEVVRQVTGAGLDLATRLELPLNANAAGH